MTEKVKNALNNAIQRCLQTEVETRESRVPLLNAAWDKICATIHSIDEYNKFYWVDLPVLKSHEREHLATVLRAMNDALRVDANETNDQFSHESLGTWMCLYIHSDDAFDFEE